MTFIVHLPILPQYNMLGNLSVLCHLNLPILPQRFLAISILAKNANEPDEGKEIISAR
jgi:hypothetical protein